MKNLTMKLKKATTMALRHFLGVDEEESLLVITDQETLEIGEAFYESGKKFCKESYILKMETRKLNGEEPPEFIAEAMRNADIVVCPTAKSLAHTAAVFKAARVGVRVATLPEITPESLIRSINIDYDKTIKFTEKVQKRLEGISRIRVTHENGTDLSMEVEGRKLNVTDGMLNTLSSFGHMPGGEISIAPIENKTNGTLILNQSLSLIGKIENLVTMDIVNGVAERVSGHGGEARIFARYLHKGGNEGKTLCEIGFGTNHRTQFCGLVLEDMKTQGAVHFGFGNNISLGGKNYTPMHNDGVLEGATVWVDDELFVDEGELVVD